MSFDLITKGLSSGQQVSGGFPLTGGGGGGGNTPPPIVIVASPSFSQSQGAVQMLYGDANWIFCSYSAGAALTLTAITLTLSLLDGGTPVNAQACTIVTNDATVVVFAYFLDTLNLSGPGTYRYSFTGTFSGSPAPRKLASGTLEVRVP